MDLVPSFVALADALMTDIEVGGGDHATSELMDCEPALCVMAPVAADARRVVAGTSLAETV